LRYLQQFRPWKTIVNNRIILTRGNVHRSDPDLVMVASDEITLGLIFGAALMFHARMLAFARWICANNDRARAVIARFGYNLTADCSTPQRTL
jgi:hypothetical protein